jgi:hypothetical protein
MDNIFPNFNALQESLSLTLANLLSQILIFVPRVIAAVIIFGLGITLARWIKKIIVTSLEKLRISAELEKTPIQGFLKNADVTMKIEVIVGGVIYWLLLLIVLQTSISVLGLTAVSTLLEHVLLYIPNVISAVIILIFGVLLAGLAETLVKGALKALDLHSARMLGTLTSYLVMVVSIMAAISELGIAQQFITTLFMGVIAAVALATGLAFGLGSKDTVAKIMDEWYTKLKKE